MGWVAPLLPFLTTLVHTTGPELRQLHGPVGRLVEAWTSQAGPEVGAPLLQRWQRFLQRTSSQQASIPFPAVPGRSPQRRAAAPAHALAQGQEAAGAWGQLIAEGQQQGAQQQGQQQRGLQMLASAFGVHDLVSQEWAKKASVPQLLAVLRGHAWVEGQVRGASQRAQVLRLALEDHKGRGGSAVVVITDPDVQQA